MTIGEELRAYRQSQGLTLAQMGERLDCNLTFVHAVEQGRAEMPARWLLMLPEHFEDLYLAHKFQREVEKVSAIKASCVR